MPLPTLPPVRGLAWLLVTFLGAVSSAFGQGYTYTTLLNPFTDGGADTVATGINADGMIAGSYGVYDAEYNGEGSLGFTLQGGNWTSYTYEHASLNRTQITGISGDTLFGTYAATGQEDHKDPSIWFNVLGFVVGEPAIDDPNADSSDPELGTYVTGYDGATVVGFYNLDQNTVNGFSLVGGTYADLSFRPNAVDGNRIVGAGSSGSVPAGVIQEAGIATPYLPPVDWGATATVFTAISGDLVAGYFNNGYSWNGSEVLTNFPFLYNIVTDQWTQLEMPSGVVSMTPSGMLGATIVGSYQTWPYGATYAFVGTTTAVPEPATTAVAIAGGILLLAAWRKRLRRRYGDRCREA